MNSVIVKKLTGDNSQYARSPCVESCPLKKKIIRVVWDTTDVPFSYRLFSPPREATTTFRKRWWNASLSNVSADGYCICGAYVPDNDDAYNHLMYHFCEMFSRANARL